MYGSVQGYHDALEKSGIKYVCYESPGIAHEWLTWQRCLHQIAPLPFTSKFGSLWQPYHDRIIHCCYAVPKERETLGPRFLAWRNSSHSQIDTLKII